MEETSWGRPLPYSNQAGAWWCLECETCCLANINLPNLPRSRHTNPKVTMTMREVMKNQKLLGSTMGSHKDLVDATNFLAEHRIVPVVSHVLDGLESADEGFRLLDEGSHFGKIVIRMPSDSAVAILARL